MGEFLFGLAVVLAAVAGLISFGLGGLKLAQAGERIAQARRDSRYRQDVLDHRLSEQARREAAERVAVLGEECEDNLIAANLATQLRQPNMAAACRRAAQRCAREALSVAHEAAA